jgi:hypothetical protein
LENKSQEKNQKTLIFERDDDSTNITRRRKIRKQSQDIQKNYRTLRKETRLRRRNKKGISD